MKLEALGGAPAALPEPKEVHIVKHYEYMDLDLKAGKDVAEMMRRTTLHTFRKDELPLYMWKRKWSQTGQDDWQAG